MAGVKEQYKGINELKNVLNNHGGVSRLCKYRIDFSGFGSSIPSTLKDNLKELSILAENVTVPGKILSAVKYRLVGVKDKDIPTNYETSELSVDFIAPNDYYMRELFYEWQENIINSNSYLISYRMPYTCDMQIYMLNDHNRDSYKISVTEVYPISYTSQPFSASSNEYGKVSVNFAYHKIEEEKLPLAGQGGAFETLPGDLTFGSGLDELNELDLGDAVSGLFFSTKLGDGTAVPGSTSTGIGVNPYDQLQKKYDERIGALPQGLTANGIPTARSTPLGNVASSTNIESTTSDQVNASIPPEDLAGANITPAEIDPVMNVPTSSDNLAITQQTQFSAPTEAVESNPDFNEDETADLYAGPANVPAEFEAPEKQKQQAALDAKLANIYESPDLEKRLSRLQQVAEYAKENNLDLPEDFYANPFD